MARRAWRCCVGRARSVGAPSMRGSACRAVQQPAVRGCVWCCPAPFSGPRVLPQAHRMRRGAPGYALARGRGSAHSTCLGAPALRVPHVGRSRKREYARQQIECARAIRRAHPDRAQRVPASWGSGPVCGGAGRWRPHPPRMVLVGVVAAGGPPRPVPPCRGTGPTPSAMA